MEQKRKPMNFAGKIANLVSTCFYISYIPRKIISFKKNTGAGFLGTAAAFALSPLVPDGHLNFLIFFAAAFGIALWAAGKTNKFYGTQDDPRIIIDEVMGYWTAIAFLPHTLNVFAAAFILFRILDTLKLWPIKKAEKKFHGAFGIIVDDIIAGIEVNLIIRAALVFL